MRHNPLLKLAAFGQSVWLDYIRRDMLRSGELGRLIQEDGLRGMTSNPAIFEKAIGGSDDYAAAIQELSRKGKTAEEIYWSVATQDVRHAADLFRPLYDESGGRHGFVSLEVSPHLAGDTSATIAQARELWANVDRPNVLIKVPGTKEGLPAIEQLVSEGVNVNVTLLFGLPRYREVAEAYLAGLERRVGQGKPIDLVESVASFFLSRIDVMVDPALEDQIATGGEKAELARAVRGQVAIASAKLAYQIYRQVFESERFQKLAASGAGTQRVLWASTSTKNPNYSDVKYVEPLIGPDTINTLPPQTLKSYRDHGRPAARLEEGLQQAKDTFRRLPRLGIHVEDVTARLEAEGIDKFVQPYDRLIATIDRKRVAATVSG